MFRMKILRLSNDDKHFYQWDTGRKLIVSDSVCDRVYFSNDDMELALTCNIYEADGLRMVNVPNILLQTAKPVKVHLSMMDSDGILTTYSEKFPVAARKKPENYVYTETEALNYAYLDERLKDLEGEGLANAVADYLKENPIEAGATAEEAKQIQQNKTNIEQLAQEKLDASKLPEAVNDALAQAKASGDFKGEPGKTPVKGEDYFTEADRLEIAEQAAKMVEIPEGDTVELDTTLTASGKAADAKAVGDALNGKLSKSGGTMTGKIVFPTGDQNAGFANSEDMKIMGYGGGYLRFGDTQYPVQLRGAGTNPMFNDKKILLEGDTSGSILTVETITVDDSGEPVNVPVTGITLDYTTMSLKVGDMMQLAAMVTPSNATNSAVTWETSDGNVATVSSGLVTAKSEGNATITAKSVENPSIKATCAVSVAAAESGGEPEVTLSSISATYSGGDVAVGTAVTDLTGIVVTAHYSDGSSQTVTDYTLSGTIAEGNNTIAVSYGGKATTFTVTGVAATTGGKVQFSTLEWKNGFYNYNNNKVVELNNNYHVEIPYTEGMEIHTFMGNNETSGYYPFNVKSGDSYLLPEGVVRGELITWESSLSYHTTVTLTGYDSDSTVIVNFSAKNTDPTVMDESGYFYYIPGGEN